MSTTTENVLNNFTEFVHKDSFNSLAGCSVIVGVMTQALKLLIPLNPLIIVFVMSIIVSVVKVILSNDYSRQNIMLAVINVFPLALTAAGGYDLIKTVYAIGD